MSLYILCRACERSGKRSAERAENRVERSGAERSGAERGEDVAENDGAGAERGAGGCGAGSSLNRPLTARSIGVILGGYEGYAYPPLFKVGGTVPPTFKRYKSGYFCLHLVT